MATTAPIISHWSFCGGSSHTVWMGTFDCFIVEAGFKAIKNFRGEGFGAANFLVH